MILRTLKNGIVLNAKNLVGWRTKRKILVISVDDYGAVRISTKEARNRLNQAGFPARNRFDALDTLETKQDLEMLFDTLRSVEDQTGRPAIFTPFAVPCNINFEKIAKTGYKEYYYELLPETYHKLSAIDPHSYAGAWELWKEGIETGLLKPQFHGREHINIKVFEEKLRMQDPELLTCLENRSFPSISDSGYKTISPLAAFDFWTFEENERFHSIIKDGLNQFENVYKYQATNFAPPSYSIHSKLYQTLKKEGIRFVDTALVANEHQGNGTYKRKINYTGKGDEGLHLVVRNVVFEPSADRDIDWPSYAMQQIEAAFRWHRPAIISSHRVNFCGHIDPANRREGLRALKELLERVTTRWPEVEFMAADELGRLIDSA